MKVGLSKSRVVATAIAALLLGACGGTKQSAEGTPPTPTASPPTLSPSASPTFGVSDADAAFCAEYEHLRSVLVTVNKVSANPASQSITNAITVLGSEAGRLHVIADGYRKAGDDLKAQDIDSLADGLDAGAQDLQSILSGGQPGGMVNVAILTQQAIQGVSC